MIRRFKSSAKVGSKRFFIVAAVRRSDLRRLFGNSVARESGRRSVTQHKRVFQDLTKNVSRRSGPTARRLHLLFVHTVTVAFFPTEKTSLFSSDSLESKSGANFGFIGP
jgi:hypothetical protein